MSAAAAAPNALPTPIGHIVIKITNPNIETAIARVSGTNQAARLDEDVLALKSCSKDQYISVWAPGYLIKKIPCNGSAQFEYPATLDPLPAVDNPNYAWNSVMNCYSCHSGQSLGLNEYTEWSMDKHSNQYSYFWNVYTGSFRADYPNENGNCAFCHIPAALPALQQGTDLRTWNGSSNIETEGITCDVCHKVTDVAVGENGRPIAGKPGILSLELVASAVQ